MRKLAQAATSKEIADNKLRRLLAHNNACECADAHVGDKSIIYGQIGQKSATQWRGPEDVMDMDEIRVSVKTHSQTFKEA